MITHRTGTHTFITFKSIKRRTDQNMRQKIETHILGLGRHTWCPWDSDDHMVRPRRKNQCIHPESPSIINTPYNNSHRVRLRMFQANTAAYRATGRSPHTHIPHSFPLVSLFRYVIDTHRINPTRTPLIPKYCLSYHRVHQTPVKPGNQHPRSHRRRTAQSFPIPPDQSHIQRVYRYHPRLAEWSTFFSLTFISQHYYSPSPWPHSLTLSNTYMYLR